jgi:hypothetical protein
VPTVSRICPAGVFIRRRMKRFSDRMRPTVNEEMPSTVPSVGIVGNATPPPPPPKNTPATRLPTT